MENVEYQVYGKPIIKDHTGAVFDKSTVGNPYLFTAREYDDGSGLFYYRARYYSAEIGRFLQEDPKPRWQVDLSNLFGYAGNNPTKFIDPRGTALLSPAVLPPVIVAILTINCGINWVLAGISTIGYKDQFRHCFVACSIAKSCGRKVAEAAGEIWEYLETLFDQPYDPDDIRANEAGAAIGVGDCSSGVPSREDCATGCGRWVATNPRSSR
ncbi:MAG: RHS repeat-associated core domain-containing protein [Elusimicrobia bacterium]|nr:RHS repeat-associated core domain-containing protein [Elusimicrobiota bacterium]